MTWQGQPAAEGRVVNEKEHTHMSKDLPLQSQDSYISLFGGPMPQFLCGLPVSHWVPSRAPRVFLQDKVWLFCLEFDALQGQAAACLSILMPIPPSCGPRHGSRPATCYSLNFSAAGLQSWLWCLAGISSCCFSALCHLYLWPCFSLSSFECLVF